MKLRELRKKIEVSKKSRRKRLRLGFWYFFISSFILFFSLAFLYVAAISVKLPSSGQLNAGKASQSTKIFDRTGDVQLFEAYGEEKRTLISFEDVPKYVKFAALAAEDANFYNQPAFDWKGIARAFIVNLKRGRVVQGGSTITQQLAKNVFLTPERTIVRKVKELIIATELESKYTKDEILEMYLNQIPFGSNVYGIEAASQTFLDKPAKELDLAEAVALSSMLKAPSYYSPWGVHTKELYNRKDYVLQRMLDLSFVTKEEYDTARIEKIDFQKKPAEVKAYHFALLVREYLINKYGEDAVNKGGLRVKTTLDWRFQEIAERVVKNGAVKNTELYDGHNAAMVVEDPKTGQILALVGSKDFAASSEPEGCVPGVNCKFESDFNVATQGLRQPGSALKPFVYLTAFEKGYSPKTMVFDVPTEFSSGNSACPVTVDFTNKNKSCFHPQNFDESFRGPISFAQSLSQSINVTSVKALYLAGLDDVLKVISKFGVKTLTERSRYGLSLVLGGGEVRLVELVNAYATLSQDGLNHAQSYILEVKGADGRVLESYKDKSERAMNEQSPRLINQILSDVDLRSGLFHGSLALTIFDREVALKTGTTNDYRDAWALGYTPNLVLGVWAGNNDNTPMQKKGGSILAAIPMWSDFLREALQYLPPESFPRPEQSFVSSKPMMNGNYIYKPELGGIVYPQIHSILYYTHKNDPLGQFPSEPYNDPQFVGWETGAINWANENLSSFGSLYNKPLPVGAEEKNSFFQKNISINGFGPANGSFVKSPFLVYADIIAKNNLSNVELYFNGKLVANQPAVGTNFKFSWFVFNQILSQNNIELRAYDILGNVEKESVVVYN